MQSIKMANSNRLSMFYYTKEVSNSWRLDSMKSNFSIILVTDSRDLKRGRDEK